MAEQRWAYDARLRRFRDLRTGRILSEKTVSELRDGLLESRELAARALAADLAAGRLSPVAWQDGMQALIRQTAMAEYLLGRGGVAAMTPADYGRVGDFIREQRSFFRAFAARAQAGPLSDAQLAARAAMYAHAGVAAQSLGLEAAYGGQLVLPAHPGVGTACKSRCRCSWSIAETAEAWRCTWLRSAADSCETCVGRAAAYAPYVQPKAIRTVVAVGSGA